MYIKNSCCEVNNWMDFIALEDNELDDIFEIVNSLQMVFHPYYASEKNE